MKLWSNSSRLVSSLNKIFQNFRNFVLYTLHCTTFMLNSKYNAHWSSTYVAIFKMFQILFPVPPRPTRIHNSALRLSNIREYNILESNSDHIITIFSFICVFTNEQTKVQQTSSRKKEIMTDWLILIKLNKTKYHFLSFLVYIM